MTTLAKVLELAGIAPDAMTVSKEQFDSAVAIARRQGAAKAAMSAGDALNAAVDGIVAKHSSPTGRFASLRSDTRVNTLTPGGDAVVDRLVALAISQNPVRFASSHSNALVNTDASQAVGGGLNAAVDCLVARLS